MMASQQKLRVLFTSGLRECVVFGAPIVLATSPFRTDPAVLFEFVKRPVESALTYLKDLPGHLPDALRDRPTMRGFQAGLLSK